MPLDTAALLAASGPATPSIAPCAEALRSAREAPLHGVGQEGGGDRPAARHQPDREAEARCRAGSAPRTPPSRRSVGHKAAEPGRHRHAVAPPSSMFSRISDTPNRPITTAIEVEPRAELDRAEGEAHLAGHDVHARRRRAPRRAPIMHTPFSAEPWIISMVQTRPSSHKRAVFRRPEADGEGAERAARRRSAATRPSVPAMKEPRPPCRAPAPRAPASPSVAVEAGDDGGRLARDVHQDGGDRAAIHRAVEDRGQHRDRGRPAAARPWPAGAATAPRAARCPAARRSGCRSGCR